MLNQSMFTEDTFTEIMADPAMTLAMLKMLENEGFKYSIPLHELSIEDRQEALIKIYAFFQRHNKELH